jgi:hypothetical protein
VKLKALLHVVRTVPPKTYQIFIISKFLECKIKLIKACEVWETKTYSYKNCTVELCRKVPNEKKKTQIYRQNNKNFIV